MNFFKSKKEGKTEDRKVEIPVPKYTEGGTGMNWSSFDVMMVKVLCGWLFAAFAYDAIFGPIKFQENPLEPKQQSQVQQVGEALKTNAGKTWRKK